MPTLKVGGHAGDNPKLYGTGVTLATAEANPYYQSTGSYASSKGFCVAPGVNKKATVLVLKEPSQSLQLQRGRIEGACSFWFPP